MPYTWILLSQNIEQFLWQKITQATLEHAGTNLKTMSRYLQYISPEQIDATNINQYLRNQKIP